MIRRELLPEILATEDVADAFGRTSRFARRLFQRGEIPGRKVGRRWFTTREALLAHLAHGARLHRAPDTLRLLCEEVPE